MIEELRDLCFCRRGVLIIKEFKIHLIEINKKSVLRSSKDGLKFYSKNTFKVTTLLIFDNYRMYAHF